MKKLLLFDIDGTLIQGGGAGRVALDKACHALYGRADCSKGFRFDGKTDRAIVREMYSTVTGNAISDTDPQTVEKTLDKILSQYLEFLPEAVSRSERYKVLPGVSTLVALLAQNRNFLLGLATGNLERGARIKLERGKLNEYFSFGGFGCDAEVRSQLVDRAIHRAKKQSGVNFANDEIYLIGDTHHDIEAGKTLGVKTVAVATGSFSTQELAKSTPNFLFENFADVEKLFKFFSDENS